MWVMLVLVLWQNNVGVTHVKGFTTLEACVEAGTLLRRNNKTVGGPSYSTACLPVK